MNSIVLSCLALLLILITAVCAACQPTPEKAAVVYGRDLEEKIARSSTSLAAYNAPESWQETLNMKGSKTKVDIDAIVSVPDVTAFPAYRVEQAPPDGGQFQLLLDYFVQHRDVIKGRNPIKEEIHSAIVAAKMRDDQELVEYLESMLESAPQTVEEEYIQDWTLTDELPGISGFAALDDGTYASVSFAHDGFGFGNGFLYADDDLASANLESIGELTISEAEAADAAGKLLDTLGIKNKTVSEAEKRRLYPYAGVSFLHDVHIEKATEGYLVTFVNDVSGIKAAPFIESEGFYSIDEFDYSAPFYDERIEIYVNETGGVQLFRWSWPLLITETVTENIDLLRFDDVKERIRSLLFQNYAYEKLQQIGGHLTTLDVVVDRIDFRMALINAKDNPAAALYVPSWYIHCNKTYTMFDVTDPDNPIMLDHEDNPLVATQTFVINAVDGGRVKALPIDSMSFD